MRRALLASVLAFAVPAAFAEDHDHEDAPEPAHGGEMVEVGEHVAFLEVSHDPKTGTLLVWSRDHDGEVLGLKDAPKLNLKTKDGNRQIVMKALDLKDGTASAFEATGDCLKADPIDGRISVKIGDTQYQVAPEPEGHDHDHDHDHDHK
jgi:hypothetical protein